MTSLLTYICAVEVKGALAFMERKTKDLLNFRQINKQNEQIYILLISLIRVSSR